MTESDINKSLSNINLNDDDISIRHKKERKNLQAQIQALKKTAGKGDKKKKKEVLEEIAQLETDLDRRHEDELSAATAFVPKRQSDDDAGDEGDVDDASTADNARISKAQKRRDKKAKEEKEREAAILAHEELNKNGPRIVEMEGIKAILNSRQLTLHSIPSDGDCLYNAIRNQLIITGRKAIDINELRQSTADYILSNKDSLIFYMSNNETGDSLSDDEFIKYCDAVRNTKAWGGHIEIKALSDTLQVPIEVLQSSGPPTIQGEEFGKPNLVITYHRHMYSLGEHYNGTKPTPTVDEENDLP